MSLYFQELTIRRKGAARAAAPDSVPQGGQEDLGPVGSRLQPRFPSHAGAQLGSLHLSNLCVTPLTSPLFLESSGYIT